MIARSRNHARCFLVWASLTTLVVLAQALALDVLRAALVLERAELAATSFEDLLLVLCSALALACGAWWWLASTLVVVGAARGRLGVRRSGYPDLLRRWLLTACGVVVIGSTASTGAYAASAGDPRPVGQPALRLEPSLGDSRFMREAIAGLPLPERIGIHRGIVLDPPPPERRPAPSPGLSGARPEPRSVIVRPGDTLWEIASRDLRPGADTAAISAAWHELYALNRSLIGPDPDLIHPGLRLRLPSAGQE